MAEDAFSSESFDKLLDDFISAQLTDADDTLAEIKDKKNNQKSTSLSKEPETPSAQPTEEVSSYSLAAFSEDAAKLATEEKQLFNAYLEFISAVVALGNEAGQELPEFDFSAKDLLPRFRPNRSKNLLNDVSKGWDIIITTQSTRLKSLPENPSDEQILSFAEKTTSKNLQNALISYVETLLETDSCEIAYNIRKVKYEKHKIEKQIFEEQQRRKEQTKKYIQAIKKENFPVNAEMLVTNFFKTRRKDPVGAAKILENNPATFAPIQVDKIPPRFFGLIKPKPEDGIKINRKLGKFLKTLKV